LHKAKARGRKLSARTVRIDFGGFVPVSTALAQDPAATFPNKPIKIIVCVPAGGWRRYRDAYRGLKASTRSSASPSLSRTAQVPRAILAPEACIHL
jgi:hypothetical protein